MTLKQAIEEAAVRRVLNDLVDGGYIKTRSLDGQPAYWWDETCRKYDGEYEGAEYSCLIERK